MIRLALKGFVFLLPIIVYLATTAGLAFQAGEFTSLEEVAQTQYESDLLRLYGRAYRDNFCPYKIALTRLRQPDVLILGSSRVSTFRAELLNKKPAVFLNATGCATYPTHFTIFFEQLEEHQYPKILIIGIDQKWFNPAFSRPKRLEDFGTFDYEDSLPELTRVLRVSQDVFADLLTGRIDAKTLWERESSVYEQRAIGVNAIVNSAGYRNDGSRLHFFINNPVPSVEARLRPDYNAINIYKTGEYTPTADYDQQTMADLREFLAFCAKHDIYVIGFSPPFAPSVYQKMVDSGNYGFMFQVFDVLPQIFDEHGFSYFNFSDGNLPNTGDADYWDGVHGSEYVYLQMYIQILETLPDQLSPYSNLDYLRYVSEQPRPNAFEAFETR